jgi:hypothetical protein
MTTLFSSNNPRWAMVASLAGAFALLVTAGAAAQSSSTAAASPSDAEILLNIFQKKGLISNQDASQAREALEANRKGLEDTNAASSFKFKTGGAIQSMELFGDLRFRYEYRAGVLGAGTKYAGDVDALNRWRYALRLGVRGDLTDDFYYGVRLETGVNPRSTWNTFGNNGASQAPYEGPFSKANNFAVYIGQAYLGWRPTPWLDLGVGKVPQPLYTTPMVWDSDYNPEGFVERLKFAAGPVDFFATFGQYTYQDVNPSTPAAFIAPTVGNSAWLLAWQAGANYHIDTNTSFKLAPALYNYVAHGNTSAGSFGSTFVGQGTTLGLNYGPGAAALTTSSSTLPGASATAGGYNQTGINNLFIFELPGELNFKAGSLDARVFGDFALNLAGDDRARAAYATGKAEGAPFPGGLQLGQDMAYQAGFAIGNNLGLVNGTTARKHTWEARVYWQHVEQYALDPNLLDSDFFEGRGNLEGIYAAVAYSLTDAVIGTLRYGHAERIDKNLGTGGFNADLPLPNPIEKYDLVQVDLTMKF